MVEPRRVLVIAAVALSSGCAEWPRFANRPDDAGVLPAIPQGPPTIGEEVDEGAADWPGTPAALDGERSHTVDTLHEATVFRGTLSPWGGQAAGGPAFGCPEADELAGTYQGDVDFQLLRSNTGTRLCLLLDAPPGDDETSAWDVVVYRFAEGCLTGPFLTQPAAEDDTQPGWTVPGGRAWVDWADPGDLAVYVTGARGAYATDPGYTLHVVPVATWEACEALELGEVAP